MCSWAKHTWGIVALAGAMAIPTLSAQSNEALQRSIEKGGTNWSSPKSIAWLFRAAPGNHLWIWPSADVVVTMSHLDPRMTLNWRWRRPRGERPSTTLAVRVIVMTQQGAVTAVVPSAGILTGIDADRDGGLCTLVLTELAGKFSGDARGTVTMFVHDATGPPTVSLSNFLRLKLHLIEGALDYRHNPPSGSWQLRQLSLASPGVDVQFSPDGERVAVTTEDGRVDLWDVRSGALRGRSTFKIGRGTRVRFNDVGDRLVLWDPEKERVVLADGRTLQLDHEIALPGGRFAGDVQFVAMTTRVAVKLVERERVNRNLFMFQERGVFFWDRATRAAVTTLGGRPGAPPISGVGFSSDGRQMVSWWAEDVWLWDVTANEEPRRVALGNVIPIHVQFVDGGDLFVMTKDGRAFQWNPAAAEVRRPWSFAPARSVSLRWPVLAVSDGNREVVIWDARTAVRRGEPFTEHPDGAPAVVLSDDGGTLLAGSSRSLVVWDVATHQAMARWTIDGPALPAEQWEPAIDANGTAVAVTRDDRRTLMLWIRPLSTRD